MDDAVNYAAEDSLLTYRLFQILYPRLIKERANFVYNNIDLPLKSPFELKEDKKSKEVTISKSRENDIPKDLFFSIKSYLKKLVLLKSFYPNIEREILR